MFHISKTADDKDARVGIFYNTQLVATITATQKGANLLDVEVLDGFSNEMAYWSDFIEED